VFCLNRQSSGDTATAWAPATGSIIETIITAHTPTNDPAAPSHVCPGIGIHAIDIVQPPGIGMPPMSDMDTHKVAVNAALPAKSSVEVPKRAGCEVRSKIMGRDLLSRRLATSTACSSLAVPVMPGVSLCPQSLFHSRLV